jgi:glycosyltransferase involved in cell wall biosynthesis
MGGAEVFTREIAKRWVEAGHRITLFTSEFPNCRNEEVVDAVRIVRAGGRYSVYWKAKRYYKKFFSKEHYDIVIDEINTRPFLTPKFVNGRAKIIALIHQLAREFWFYETPFPVNYLGYHFLEDRWLKNYVDVPTVTVSESTKQDLADVGIKKVSVIPGGADFEPLDRLPNKEKYPVITYIGRLKEAKRVDHAIKAFKIVKENTPEAELWIVGSGYFSKELEKLSFNGVKFFGHVSHERKLELIKRSWVLVHPSVREGFPLSIIEANALGTPYIAYDVAGLRDAIITEKTGLLVESGNIPKMAESMMKVLKNEMLRKKLSENALRYSERFSWDRTATEFMNIIMNISSQQG